RSMSVGRLATYASGRPHIVPVNFVVDGRTIVFRTAEGAKLSAGPASPRGRRGCRCDTALRPRCARRPDRDRRPVPADPRCATVQRAGSRRRLSCRSSRTGPRREKPGWFVHRGGPTLPAKGSSVVSDDDLGPGAFPSPASTLPSSATA
ncbi:MAG: pyridoxamine 5'-phosphate oxidase family protein, partial [Acidimicrobiia bacterium]|nr:pyridoxamine 5'-phosphate oxidase family protein [Acidimicrobiia bacterium]